MILTPRVDKMTKIRAETEIKIITTLQDYIKTLRRCIAGEPAPEGWLGRCPGSPYFSAHGGNEASMRRCYSSQLGLFYAHMGDEEIQASLQPSSSSRPRYKSSFHHLIDVLTRASAASEGAHVDAQPFKTTSCNATKEILSLVKGIIAAMPSPLLEVHEEYLKAQQLKTGLSW